MAESEKNDKIVVFCFTMGSQKGINSYMPLCPQCSTRFHTGARDQCPSCGYSLLKAEQSFGDGYMELTRVIDSAGQLTFKDRENLVSFLESVERRISPVALSIYFTDFGQSQQLSQHAHWLLNHSRINHAAFGKRDLQKAREESILHARKRQAESTDNVQPVDTDEGGEGFLNKFMRSVVNAATRTGQWLRDAIYPCPPPVRREWLLILVVDVQSEIAFFTWGYMLDNYIDPAVLDACIKETRLSFREREMRTSIKTLIKKAVRRIASRAIAVNSHMKWQQRQVLKLAKKEARKTTPPTSPTPPTSASNLLLFSFLLGGMLGLSPLSAQQPTAPNPAPVQWSEDLLKAYLSTDKQHYLRDPQLLLTTMERELLGGRLQQFNESRRYRVYINIYDSTQADIPEQLAHERVFSIVCSPRDYAILIQYHIGQQPAMQLGYQHIALSDEEKAQLLSQLRESAMPYADDLSALREVLRLLGQRLDPLAAQWDFSEQAQLTQLPKADIQLPEVAKSTKPRQSQLEKVESMLEEVRITPMIWLAISFASCILLYIVGRWLRRQRVTLRDTKPDYRLSSPYGAAVSQQIYYMQGKEAQMESYNALKHL